MSRVLLWIFSKCYKACKGGDKRSRTTDIDSKQQLFIIVRKLWKKDRWGDIADELAGKCREDKRVFFEKEGEKVAHNIDSCHIARKNKEEHEGEEKAVVHLQKRHSVE